MRARTNAAIINTASFFDFEASQRKQRQWISLYRSPWPGQKEAGMVNQDSVSRLRERQPCFRSRGSPEWSMHNQTSFSTKWPTATYSITSVTVTEQGRRWRRICGQAYASLSLSARALQFVSVTLISSGMPSCHLVMCARHSINDSITTVVTVRVIQRKVVERLHPSLE